jgi:hypothetical protein
MPALHRTAEHLEVFKIAATDTNKFAVIADPIRDQVPFFACVEIFDPGGATPPNTHADAHEMFFVLAGTGIARAGSVETVIGPGVPPCTSKATSTDFAVLRCGRRTTPRVFARSRMRSTLRIRRSRSSTRQGVGRSRRRIAA